MTQPSGQSEAEDNPVVSIVLVNYRTPAMTLDCLASVEQHCRAVSYEIIVVDNNSGDDSVERLRESPIAMILLPLADNGGFGAGCNAGARVARGRYIYLLNTDTLMVEDSVGVLADFLDRTPSAAAVGSRLKRPDGTMQHSALYFPTPLRVLIGSELLGGALGRRFPSLLKTLSMLVPEDTLTEPCPVDWCAGASLMIRASAYREVGGFDERFFLYCEETDLCKRLLSVGGTWFHPGTTVIHLEGASHGEGEISDRRMGYAAAGRRLYYRKHHSLPGAFICNLADGGGALAKGLVWWVVALIRGGADARCRAKRHLAYARNYFRYSYPLETVTDS